jgi:hypothetical protein
MGFQQPKLYIAATLVVVQKSISVTLVDPHWQAAVEEEYTTLVFNDTWDFIPRPRDSNVDSGC